MSWDCTHCRFAYFSRVFGLADVIRGMSSFSMSLEVSLISKSRKRNKIVTHMLIVHKCSFYEVLFWQIWPIYFAKYSFFSELPRTNIFYQNKCKQLFKHVALEQRVNWYTIRQLSARRHLSISHNSTHNWPNFWQAGRF